MNWDLSALLIDRCGHLIELVETLMVAQTKRLALHLEIPAVPRRALMQIAIGRELARTCVASRIGETRAALGQLRQQRLERLADAHERRNTFFVQLGEEVLVLPGGLVKAHV